VTIMKCTFTWVYSNGNISLRSEKILSITSAPVSITHPVVSVHAVFFQKKKKIKIPRKKPRKIIFGVSDDDEPLVFPDAKSSDAESSQSDDNDED
jgi:hypothetical protein